MAGLLSLGARAMGANYMALQTTGNNIANANTPGYSRQQVELANENGQFTGGGFIGRGVRAQTITRSHNEFMNKEAGLAKSVAAAAQSRSERLDRLESVFPMGESGVGNLSSKFFNAFVDVANVPRDLSARQVVLAKAQDIASAFKSASDQIDSMQKGLVEDIKGDVATINGLTKQVANINQEIARLHGSGQPPNDLLDQRDELVRKIGEYLQVTTIPADDGTLGVFAAGGQRLVLSNQSVPLSVATNTSGQAVLQVTEASAVNTLSNTALGGGSIAGLMQFQDNDLTSAKTLLGDIATAFVTSVNTQQAAGLNLRVPPTTGAPIFSQSASNPLNIQVVMTDPRDIAASTASATNPASNNENALAFVNLRDAALLNGDTIANGYAAAMTDIGVRVQSAKINKETTANTAQQTESVRTGASGVNLDEEAARLLQFQQSYQAAAKVLQVAQTLFENVLNLGR